MKTRLSYFCEGKLCSCPMMPSEVSEQEDISNTQEGISNKQEGISNKQQAVSNEQVTINFRRTEEEIVVLLTPIKPIELQEAWVELPYEFTETSILFLNGYQSWTDSIEHGIHDKMPGLNRVPKWLVSKYALNQYGDYNFVDYSGKKGKLHGFTYGYVREGEEYLFLGSLSECSGYTILKMDTKHNTIRLEKDCKGRVITEPYELFHIAISKGNSEQVFQDYFDRMKLEAPNAKPILGYTSWYEHYQNITEDIILNNLEAIKREFPEMDVFQIDDGYELTVGDWLTPDPVKFPHGMKPLSDAMKNKGLLSGIWLAPFVCEERSQLKKEHPNWLLRDKNGNLVMGGNNWSGFYALDFYNNEVREYIRKVFHTIIEEWGYGLVKLDFLYAVCIEPRPDKTRGEIMCEAMDFLRECVGNAKILGCGVPLGPAFGKVEYCRIGCDVSLDWDDKPWMRLLHRERTSTRNCIGNTIGRRQLDGRAFLNDPDVFLLRKSHNKLTRQQRELLLKTNARYGSVLFTSDNVGEYDEEQKKLVRDILTNMVTIQSQANP